MIEKYIQTDQLLHLLSQIIARANRTFVAPQADDSHTNLFYDSLNGRILGRWFSIGHRKFILGLDINDLLFELIDETMESVKRVYVVGKNFNQVTADVGNALKSHDFEINDYSSPLHYQIPEYDFASKNIKLPDPDVLFHWKKIRALANDSIKTFSKLFEIEVQARIWPHHFDTGIYAKVNADHSLGFGLAMSDSMVGQPYFYLSAYTISGAIDVADFTSLERGEWMHTDSWNGAILKIKDLTENEENNQKLLESFIRDSSSFYLKN